MMNKKEITTFAKKIVRAQQGLKNHQLMHPRREWMIGVFVAVSIFSASAVWSSIKYFQYQNIDHQTSVQPEAPVAVYRETLVNEALTSLGEKAQRLSKLLGDTESVPEVEAEPIVTTEEESDGEEVEAGAVVEIEEGATSNSVDEESPANEVLEDEPVEVEPAEEDVQAGLESDATIQPATNI